MHTLQVSISSLKIKSQTKMWIYMTCLTGSLATQLAQHIPVVAAIENQKYVTLKNIVDMEVEPVNLFTLTRRSRPCLF